MYAGEAGDVGECEQHVAKFQGDIGWQKFSGLADGEAGLTVPFDVGPQPPGNIGMEENLLFPTLIPEVNGRDEWLVVPVCGNVTYLGEGQKIPDPSVVLSVLTNSNLVGRGFRGVVVRRHVGTLSVGFFYMKWIYFYSIHTRVCR